MDLNKAMKESRKLVNEINANGGREWSGTERFIQLVEEIGELANAMLIENKTKPPHLRKSDLTDSVCDCLFVLLMIADTYNINLNEEYPKVLEHIRKRNATGEFRIDDDANK